LRELRRLLCSANPLAMSVRNSIAWSLLGNGAVFASSLVSGMVLARTLVPAEMGVFALSIAFMTILQATLQMGSGSLLVREKDETNGLAGSALTVALCEGLVISALLFILAAPFGEWQRSPDVAHIIKILALTPLFGAVEAIVVARWSRDLDFQSVAKLAAAKGLVQLVISISLALAGYGAKSMAIGYLAAACLAAMFASVHIWRHRIKPNAEFIRLFAVFGGQWMLLGALKAISSKSPELLLGRISGLAPVGLFNRASASVDIITRAGIEPIARVMLPVLVRDRDATGELAPGLVKLSSTLTALFWPALGALAILADPAIRVLYGDQWTSVAPVVTVLCLWMAILLPNSGTGEVLLIRDKLPLSLVVEFVRVALGCCLIVLAAPLGIVMVAWARVVEALVMVIPYVWIGRRWGGLSIRIWAAAHVRSAAMTLVGIGPLFAYRQLVQQPESPLAQLTLGCGIALISFATGTLLLKHPTVTPMVEAMIARAVRTSAHMSKIFGVSR
jgi:O-antigen/teichoic acid export membrane protein